MVFVIVVERASKRWFHSGTSPSTSTGEHLSVQTDGHWAVLVGGGGEAHRYLFPLNNFLVI